MIHSNFYPGWKPPPAYFGGWRLASLSQWALESCQTLKMFLQAERGYAGGGINWEEVGLMFFFHMDALHFALFPLSFFFFFF